MNLIYSLALGSVVLLKSLSSTIHLYLGEKRPQPSVLGSKTYTMPCEYPHNMCVCVYLGKKKHVHT